MDGNWLQVVHESGTKYLPIMKDGNVLFEKTSANVGQKDVGTLCRITAVPEKELSSGIVAGDTVKILQHKMSSNHGRH